MYDIVKEQIYFYLSYIYIVIIDIYVCFFCIYMCAPYACSAGRGQKRASDLPAARVTKDS